MAFCSTSCDGVDGSHQVQCGGRGKGHMSAIDSWMLLASVLHVEHVAIALIAASPTS